MIDKLSRLNIGPLEAAIIRSSPTGIKFFLWFEEAFDDRHHWSRQVSHLENRLIFASFGVNCNKQVSALQPISHMWNGFKQHFTFYHTDNNFEAFTFIISCEII